MERLDLSGHVLDGRYRVIEPIGRGAMGSVYRGEHLKLGRIVAIKFMNEQVPNEMASRRRFAREAQAMARLEHPHCASVLDVGMHEDQPFVVMDFVSGKSLEELVREGPVPVPRAAEITHQILSGLAHAHEHGIIHRDIKPSNIVLSQKSGLGDHVKILDFGLAKLNQETSNLTSGVVVGTPSYMAPEQIRGLLIDPRVDLYACGVLLFELLTGTKPFRSANNEPVEVCMMHLNTPAPRLADKLSGHDFGALEAVVARALEKDRDQRFATAGEFASALAQAVGRPNVATPPAGIPVVRPPRPETSPTAATVQVDSASIAPAPSPSTSVLPPTPSPSTSALAPAPSPSSSSRRRLVIGGGLLVVVGVSIAVVASTRGGASSAAPAVAAAADASAALPVPPPSEPPRGEPVADLVARASELATAGRREAAIDLLTKARRTYPDDARLPYLAGLLYLEKMWWADGLKQLRTAISLEPTYKADPTLIKAVLLGFNTTASYDWTLATFLRKDIGAAAKPYLEDTAQNHPNPLIRKRAAAELRRYR